MSVSGEQQERFHFLDGLRAVAASMVVIHHSFTANIVRFCDAHHLHFIGAMFTYIAGYGVNLFFVLSGVVLLRPYLRQQRTFKAGNYFYRRIKRIYPPYLVSLLFAAFVIWYIKTYPTWYNDKGIHVYFQWQEIVKEAVIFNFDGVYYNLAWWSLQIEMLFYVLVPLIIIIFPYRHKFSNRQIITTSVAGIILTVGLQLLLTTYVPAIYNQKHLILNLGRFVEYPMCFLLGVLLAAYDFNVKQGIGFFLGGVLLIMYSWYYQPLIHSAYGFIFAAVITFAFNIKKFRNVLDTPFMLWLGERSYSLFLIHFSVFYLIDNLAALVTPSRNAMYALITRGLGIPLGLFAAMLLFHFVERRQARGLITGDMFWPWQVRRLKRHEGE